MHTFFKIAWFELVRLLLTRRGLLFVVAFLLVWLLILRFGIWPASLFVRNNIGNPLLTWLLESSNTQILTAWSIPELGVFWYAALFLLPIFSISLTADQTASDRARGTLRFLQLRATRGEIYFGRFFGQLIILFLLVLFTVLTTLAVALYRDQQLLISGLEESLIIVPQLMLLLMPFVALMALLSILAKSPRQAIVYAIILWIVFRFGLRFIVGYFPELDFLQWILPGSQLSMLRSAGFLNQQLVYIMPALQSCLLLLLGWFVVRRIDL